MSSTKPASTRSMPDSAFPQGFFAVPPRDLEQPLEYMAAVHRRLKELCDMIEAWGTEKSVDPAVIHGFASRFPDFLRQHMDDEEKSLLPLIGITEKGQIKTSSIVDGLLRDHEECLDYVHMFCNYFCNAWSGRANDVPDHIASAMVNFAKVKRNHIAVEKNIILVIARKNLKASHLEHLREMLIQNQEPPAMSRTLDELLDRNAHWAEGKSSRDPTYFRRLSELQAPKYLWIGCSDSRVTANDVLGLEPGEVFVHRNIANVVHTSDMNMLSVLEFAIEHLHIKHIIVCGHYRCSGIERVLSKERGALVDHWLQPISMMYRKHLAFYNAMTPADRINRLCELNVEMQVRRLAQTPIVEKIWQSGKELHLHGWIYAIEDGLLRDLGPHLSCLDDRESLISIDDRARAPLDPLSSLQRQAASAFVASGEDIPDFSCGCKGESDRAKP